MIDKWPVHFSTCHLLANSFCNSTGHFKQRMYFVKSHSLLTLGRYFNGPKGWPKGPTES